MSSAGSQKAYTLTFEQREEYLYAFVEGEEDNYDISLQFWKEIFVKARETGYTKILVEEAIEEPASMMDMFQVATELPQMGISGMKIAFVDRFFEHTDLNEFGELVAQNRGAYGRIFNDVDEGIDWLLSK